MAKTVSIPSIGDIDFPDEMSNEEIAAAIKKNFPNLGGGASNSQSSAMNLDVPSAEQDAAIASDYAAKQQQEPSTFEKIGSGLSAGLRTAVTMPLAMAGSVVGGVRGIGKSIASGNFGTQEGADLAAKTASQDMQSFTSPAMYGANPLTQEYVQNVGEKLEPLAALGGVTGELSAIGQSAKAAAPVVSGAIRQDAQLIPKTAQDWRASVGGAMKAQGDMMKVTEPLSKDSVVSRLIRDETDNELATKDLQIVNPSKKDAQGNLLPEAYKVVDDDFAKEVLKQGYEAGDVASLKTADAYNSRKMLDMLNLSEKGASNSEFKISNAPANIIGDELAQQIRGIKTLNRQAGNEIDKAAEKLATETVDVSPAVNNFVGDLAQKLKVQITDESGNILRDKSGKPAPIFSGSDLEGAAYKKDQAFITNLVQRMADTKPPSAYDVHRLKRYIDKTVTYGKSNSAALESDVEYAAKSLRHNLDEILDSNFESYKTANQKYSDTVRAIDSFQSAAGNKVDLFAPNADVQLGIVSRRLMSNVQSRQALQNSIDQLHSVAKDYNLPSQANIKKLVTFANAIENRHGTSSPNGFQGEIVKAGKDIGRKAASGGVTVADVAIGAGKAVYEKTRGINDKNAYAAMRKLLLKQISKKQSEAYAKKSQSRDLVPTNGSTAPATLD
jgi:hypothetical protein